MAKILIVDDMQAIRTSLREILVDENHEVAEAKDGVGKAVESSSSSG